MRKTVMTILIFATVGLLLTGCAGLSSLGSRSATVTYNDTAWCLPLKLRRVLKRVARRYGPVTVHSTHRWWLENRRKGGASRSLHLQCRAADFSVRGDPSSVIRFLKSQRAVGGYKYYPGGFYHIDTGPRRTW